MVLDSKLPHVGTTIFTVMSKLAADHGAINLSQGFPDFDGPTALLERAVYHLTHGHNQYAPMPGVMALREQVARKVATLYGASVDPDAEVTITAGATEAIFCAITAVVRAGDEVIVFDPAYDSYEPAVTLAGGVTRHVPLVAPSFTPDWDRVRDALTKRTRLLIINTPHNPTGSIWREADLQALRELARDHDFFIVGDEVYEHIVFDGDRHESLLRYPDLYARSFVVSSFGKTYHATGWKTGYCVAPKELTVELRRIHQYVNFVANTPIQHALADYMAVAPEHATSLGAFYQKKRDLFVGLLESSRFGITPSCGTYFQLLDYSHVSNETDVELSRRLTIEAGVASIPVSVFYQHAPELRLLRFCFAKDDATLTRAAQILCRL
jgi:methionine aminotransferase